MRWPSCKVRAHVQTPRAQKNWLRSFLFKSCVPSQNTEHFLRRGIKKTIQHSPSNNPYQQNLARGAAQLTSQATSVFPSRSFTPFSRNAVAPREQSGLYTRIACDAINSLALIT